jgi:hypothetical protein
VYLTGLTSSADGCITGFSLVNDAAHCLLRLWDVPMASLAGQPLLCALHLHDRLYQGVRRWLLISALLHALLAAAQSLSKGHSLFLFAVCAGFIGWQNRWPGLAKTYYVYDR